MAVNTKAYYQLKQELDQRQVTLVAVSKTKPTGDIEDLYHIGQRDFGENYVQELVEKEGQLPADIRWHYIGHLQTNKVKYIAPFVHLIHAVDSMKLLQEIDKQAGKNNRVIDVLLQMHVAEEETKFGLTRAELQELLKAHKDSGLSRVNIRGLMAMASNTENESQVRSEFRTVKETFSKLKDEYFSGSESFSVISMGMSGDYLPAIEEGSNMVRIGSLLFGARQPRT